MSSPYGKAIVIANARAGTGKLGRDGKSLEELMSSSGIDFEIRFTKGPADATRIAAEAIGQGFKYLVAVGGDGTVHEVLNGMMDETGPKDAEVVLAVIPGGSGCDFIKTFGLPPDPADSVTHLAGEPFFEVDCGRLTYEQDGKTLVRYFANIAEAGLGGEVVRRAERLPRWVGRVRYLLSFWMTLGRFKPAMGKVQMGGKEYDGSITNLVVANAQFFGGGMRIAPKAHPADGKFDVLIQRGSKMDYVKGVSKVFKGEHLPSPAIKEYLMPKVEVHSDIPLQVEADGEVLGFTPATFEIVPKAYRLKI